MCSLLPTYLVIQSAPKMDEKKFKATIFEMFSSLQRSPPSNGFVMFMKNLGEILISAILFILYIQGRGILYTIYIEKKVKRSRQQFLVCLDLVLIDCFVTLQDLVVYGKK